MSNQPLETTFPVTILHQVYLVQLPMHLSGTSAVILKDQCEALCTQEQTQPMRIVLDLGHTKFIDSSGIGALVNAFRTARSYGVELVLWSLHPQVKMALSLTELDKVFTLDEGTEAILPVQIAKNQDLPTTHPSVLSKTKRLIDILGAIIGLVITGVLFIPLAIAIKLDSPGPIFFGQVRCGWLGKRFKMWKFRSMVINAESLKSQVQNEASGAIFKNKNDPRVTRIGRFLRKTSLDELPQFWNVLRGEMSLVGTRPPTPDEIERYEIPKWQRLDVKPGMTGEWQVHGRSQIQDFEDVIRLDLRYQQNWNLLYDIKLILKTILVLFNKNAGAY